MQFAVVRTPFGRDLYVACDDAGIVESRFVTRSAASANGAAGKQSALLREAVRQLEAYFARRLGHFSLPLVTDGTPLQRDVWNVVSTLPVGMLVSYADVARAIGRPHAHRGVASALVKTPLAVVIPAHRVVGADGRIKGAGARSMRRRLLAFEGIAAR